MATATKKRPANLTSHTELSTLAQCEMKHHLRYVEHVKGDQSDALRRGTLVHLGAAAISRGDDWEAVLAAEVAEEGADPTRIDWDLIEDQVASDAHWLLARYSRHYADLLDEVTVVAQELDLRATIPGTKQVHQAIIDEVWEVRGRLWAVERKTYGRHDRVALADVDPQLTNNLWVVRANGIEAYGILFDGIYTYRWKPEKPTQAAMMEQLLAEDPQKYGAMTKADLREFAKLAIAASPGIDRPDEESFTQLWLDRTDAHIAAAHEEIQGAIARRNALRRGARPLRNIGPLCNNCDQRGPCFERLAFPQSFDVEL